MARLLNIGFGNMVSIARIVAILGPDSAPVKRMIQETREKGRLIDATHGRKTRAVVVMDSGHAALSALHTETLSNRLCGKDSEAAQDEQ